MRKILLFILGTFFCASAAMSYSFPYLSKVSDVPFSSNLVVAVSAWPKTPVEVSPADLDRFLYCDTRKFVLKGAYLTVDDFIEHGFTFKVTCFKNRIFFIKNE